MSPRKAFLLRMDPELWRALEKWAADELRSVNGQIEYVLSRAVREARREKKRPHPHTPEGEPSEGHAPNSDPVD